MSLAGDAIIDELGCDMVSHGWLMQCVTEAGDPSDAWTAVLAELLAKQVEIGDTRLASHKYVEFIGWNGTIDERISRATQRVAAASEGDRKFAYWLALRKNVDRWETAQ